MKRTKFDLTALVMALFVIVCGVTGASAQLTLPYSGSYSGSSMAFKITDTGTSTAGWFEITNASNVGTALVGITSGTGRGLYGLTLLGDHGVFGESRKTGGTGVWGVADTGATATGVYGVSQNGRGVVGVSYSGEAGIKGQCNSTDGKGILGLADNGPSSAGVYGISVSGRGVMGVSVSGEAGIKGQCNTANGKGILGLADNGPSSAGIYGISVSGRGVVGVSVSGEAGIKGQSNKAGGFGVWGIGDNGSSSAGVYGASAAGFGVRGSSTTGKGVYGLCGGSGDAVSGYAAGTGYAGRFTINNAANGSSAVSATTNGTGSAVSAIATGGGSALSGTATGSYGTGVEGVADGGDGVSGMSTSGAGVYGISSTGSAGYFDGSVDINGELTKSSGSFKIDHPLDPANKYLYHSFVESPDMMNIYNGNVVLGEGGEAWVELPDWFEALNRDFRYQLTAIGAPGPNLYIAEKISANGFKIAGGEPGLEVSWQVTGIRQDAWANAHRVPVEEEKPAVERGSYLAPELFGQPETAGVDWARHPEKMGRRMLDRR